MNQNSNFHFNINSLITRYKYIWVLYIIFQLVFILFFPREYTNDAQYYYSLAKECVQNNEFYPGTEHLYEDYIVAPLYVNIIIVLLNIYNSHISIGLFNIIINLLQLFFVYKITRFYFDDNTAKLSVLIYIFYLNSFGLVLSNFTELLFTVLILSSIYFYLKKTTSFLFLSGIMLGTSIAVRPVGWDLAVCYLLIAGYLFFKEKKFNLDILKIAIGTFLFIILFGCFNYWHFGRFIFTSTTGPVNLLLGANDTATGGFNARVYDQGNIGYIARPDTLTYLQKGDFYYDQATNWIKQNPGKWLLLAPLKLVHTFSYDDISISLIAGLGDWNIIATIKNSVEDRNFNHILPGESFYVKLLYFLLEIIQHIFYYLLILVLVLWAVRNIKERSFSEFSLLHLFFVLIGMLMIMITVGTPRYKYPFIIMMIPFISSYIQTRFLSKINIEKL